MILRAAFLALLIAAPPAAKPKAPAKSPDSTAGVTYDSEDLVAKAPGPRWVLHTTVPGAPNLRGAYVHERQSGAGKAKVDPSSIITFGIDPAPFTKDPEAYVKSGFDRLAEPPLSFKAGKRAALTLKGGAKAFRIEYTDRDAVRHFTQVAIVMPRGGILIVTLQGPSKALFAEDLPAFLAFIDGLELKSAPAPAKP